MTGKGTGQAAQLRYIDAMAEKAEVIRYSLRLPPDLYGVLAQRAITESRTLHGEILYLLRTHSQVLASHRVQMGFAKGSPDPSEWNV